MPGWEIDHLVVTAATLEEGTAWAEARLKLPLAPGGRHARFGTWNRLLSLGSGLYLEVVAPEPGTDPGLPRWFGLDRPGAPRLAAWVARGPVAEAPPEAGEPLSLSRDAFAWTVTVPADGEPPWGGALPQLIEWARGHPADHLPDRGARLVELEVAHPRAPRLRELLAPLADSRLRIVTADAPELRARIETPGGEAHL